MMLLKMIVFYSLLLLLLVWQTVFLVQMSKLVMNVLLVCTLLLDLVKILLLLLFV
jgi:hypothetical protein